jgi:hypothetical protein
VDESSRVSFLVAIVDNFGQVQRVLIGRTTLETNPLTLPLIESIDNMKASAATGFLWMRITALFITQIQIADGDHL